MSDPLTTTAGRPDPEDAGPARYDELAAGYARHWGPVIRPAAVALLDRLDAAPEAESRLLDVGTGTGTLAIEAIARWPAVHVTGIDASGAMLQLAREEAAARIGPGDAWRFETIAGVADDLPFPPGAFDVALSSFVLQLVPNRGAALREIRRVLRPGGRLAWVTWLEGGERFRGDEVVDEVLAEAGFDPPERDGRSGDLASVDAAAAATRRAGFREVHAAAAELVHAWTPRSYTAFIAEFDEQSTFAELEPGERRRVERRLVQALERLAPDELTLRIPIVYVTGRAR